MALSYDTAGNGDDLMFGEVVAAGQDRYGLIEKEPDDAPDVEWETETAVALYGFVTNQG